MKESILGRINRNILSNIAYLSLGSNIENRLDYLSQACTKLEDLGVIKSISRIYKSPSWGFDAPEFYNLCLCLLTPLTSDDLLKSILRIEQQIGRTKKDDFQQYSSREIDIDILFYNDEIRSSDSLILPHPHISERKFVLQPLSDIASDYSHPVCRQTISTLLEQCLDTVRLTLLDSQIPKDNTRTDCNI